MKPKMHDDELEITDKLVRRLLHRQFPHLTDRHLRRVASQGTVNAIYRLGTDLVVRPPLTPRWHDIETEACWLDALAPRVSVRIPEVVAIGQPADGYPWKWGVLRWIEGEPWNLTHIDKPNAAAVQLAEMIQTLASLNPRSLPCGKPPRRPSLADMDERVRTIVDDARQLIDGDAFLDAWTDALDANGFAGKPPLAHGDLLAGNALVHEGQLHAVIDWAGISRADPAREVMAAWTLFTGNARQAFLAELGVDDDTRRRARGWALTRIFNVAYYERSNPVFSLDARRTIAEVLNDR